MANRPPSEEEWPLSLIFQLMLLQGKDPVLTPGRVGLLVHTIRVSILVLVTGFDEEMGPKTLRGIILPFLKKIMFFFALGLTGRLSVSIPTWLPQALVYKRLSHP